MLSTIWRHEFHRTKKPLVILFGVATLALALSFGLAATGLPALQMVGAIGSVIVTSAFLLLLIVGLAVDLYTSSFGAQRYLTHSLPIPGARLMWAKLGYAWLVSLVAWVWFIIALYIAKVLMAMLSGATLSQAWTTQWETVRTFLSSTPAWLLLAAFLIGILFMLSYVVNAYFAVSVGSEKRFHRFGPGGPVLVFVIGYLILQGAIMVGIFALPLGATGNGSGLDFTWFTPSVLFEKGQEIVPVGFIPAMILTSAVFLWRSHRSWSSRIDLR